MKQCQNCNKSLVPTEKFEKFLSQNLSNQTEFPKPHLQPVSMAGDGKGEVTRDPSGAAGQADSTHTHQQPLWIAFSPLANSTHDGYGALTVMLQTKV